MGLPRAFGDEGGNLTRRDPFFDEVGEVLNLAHAKTGGPNVSRPPLERTSPRHHLYNVCKLVLYAYRVYHLRSTSSSVKETSD